VFDDSVAAIPDVPDSLDDIPGIVADEVPPLELEEIDRGMFPHAGCGGHAPYVY
jgi:hypothetical protein